MNELNTKQNDRLLSIDALRGFDMLWIAGGEGVIAALAKYSHWPIFNWLQLQLEHSEWNGFHFYDLIFPLFLFLAGVSMPFSVLKRQERGDTKREIYKHLAKRLFVLIVLGMIYNGALNLDWPNIRVASVLARIGLGWFFASVIVLNFRIKGIIIWFWSILLVYWAMMIWIPVPGFGAGVLTLEGNLSAFIDRLFLPGKLFDKVMDPEGILSTLPAIATGLLGALNGLFLRNDFRNWSKQKKGFILAVVGALLIIVSICWNPFFPINKKMWTSSFVLCAGGTSMLFLSLFYLVIDVWEYRKWTFPFVVIGLNSITIYMMQPAFHGFSYFKDFVFSGIIHMFSEPVQPILDSVAYLFTGWLILYFLYKKKIFLKV